MVASSQNIMNKYKKYIMTSCVKKLEPVVLVEGKGAVVKDLDGKEYLDCWSGISVVNAGHCNPKVTKAVLEQAGKLVHVCNYVYHTVPIALLAEKLAQISPGKLQKTFFSNSGAEAVECAIKIGRKFTKKHEVIALMCSFHGRTLGTLSVTGQAGRRDYSMGPYLGDMVFAPAPYCYRCSLGQEYPRCGIQCAKIIEDIINYSTSGSVAEFIAEPVMGEGGIIVPPKEYFKEVEKILDQYGILFIADEVQSGFARTGKMFAIEHYGVDPDIMPLAKGIADGFPLGACIATPDIGDAFEPGDHLSTFGGSPVSCVASLANIDYILEEKLSEQATKKGEYLMKRLNEIKETHDIIGEVRGKGLMIGVELVRDRKNKTPADKETAKIRELFREKGILIGSGGVKRCTLRIQPPLIISQEQMDKIMDTLLDCLKRV
jgi:4-aminobutyrate aminotransferase/(S)-3-amino-2-methylpropionate transaminase